MDQTLGTLFWRRWCIVVLSRRAAGEPVHEVDGLPLRAQKNIYPVLAEPNHAWAGHSEVVAIAAVDAPNSTDVQIIACEAFVDSCDFSRAEVGVLVVDAGQRNPEWATVAFKHKHVLKKQKH